MPNIATVLRTEISRLARKELRAESDSLKKVVASQRSDIAALKRRLQDVEKVVKGLERAATANAPRPKLQSSVASAGDEGDTGGFRFRASGMASNRKRLGLSAAEFGLLVGTTGQSIYAWEAGKSKPRSKNLAAIAALRGIGKKEAAARLESLKAST